jgi:hypothetical protein
MNKKILVLSLLGVLMLVSISFVSSAEVNTYVEKKESPLYGIRTRRAITENIEKIVKNIKTKFLGERVFWIPYHLFVYNRQSLSYDTEVGYMDTLCCTNKIIAPRTYCSPDCVRN